MADLSGIIKQLITERDRLNQAITALEAMKGASRRGRPSGKNRLSAAARAKQTLFAIQRMLNETDSALKGIDRVMWFVARSQESKNCPPGCLMANTALELGLNDPGVAEEIRRMFRSVEKMLAAAVKKAQVQGEISNNLDCVAIAQGLANTISGIRILEKTGASKQHVRTVLETALAAIQR